MFNILQAIRTINKSDLAALSSSGIDVNKQDKNGVNLLHTLCWAGWKDDVEALIAAGADVNALTRHGDSPLHCACQKDRMHIVQILLEAGADPSIKNNFGLLPQDIPENEEIKDLIKNCGLGGGRATKAAIH